MKRRSLIWILDEKQFRDIVLESSNLSDVASRLNYKSSGNTKYIKKRIESLNIDTSHFPKTKPLSLQIFLKKLNTEKLQSVVDSCTSFSQISEKLEGRTGYGQYFIKKLRERAIQLNVSFDKFNKNKKDLLANGLNKTRLHPIPPLEDVLNNKVRCSSTNALKKRILKAGLIQYMCVDCGICDQWNNKPIVLHLHHINGISSDNRLENLKLLCPNCHSQTPTYAGKNIKTGARIPGTKHINYCQCGKEIGKKSKTCRACLGLTKRKNYNAIGILTSLSR